MSKRTRLGVGDERGGTRANSHSGDVTIPPVIVSPTAKKRRSVIGSTVLDKYVVEAELGSGAMGTVFRAHHTQLQRPVALKIMHAHLVPEPAMLARFYREAKAAARLAHKNVAAVLDVGETPDGKHVMVMELANGESLGEVLDRGRLPFGKIVDICVQLLRGLGHAHDMGLVHRDLKPDNVLIDRDGTARIVDFGIASFAYPLPEDGPLDKLTGTGVIIGTPLYMAPEQARCEPLDHRADLYALGIMLYEMLSGMSPFEGSAMEVAVAKMDKDPPPIAARAPGVPVDPVIDAVLARLIARAPADRFATAHDALAVLERFQTDPGAAAAAMGVKIFDAGRALAVVSLPPPPHR